MFKLLFGLAIAVILAGGAAAQPVNSAEQQERAVGPYLYLTVSDTRLWCADNGASDHEVRPSDTPKHVDQVMKYFDEYFARAKARLQQKSATR